MSRGISTYENMLEEFNSQMNYSKEYTRAAIEYYKEQNQLAYSTDGEINFVSACVNQSIEEAREQMNIEIEEMNRFLVSIESEAKEFIDETEWGNVCDGIV
ncbi:hypothetical protein [Clostridium sp. ZS2-4]|uniref:hypothetical protein n=1 Tax=Clostridium sp. ZS2-4 TaxID=2987703 RepID=UPI00227A2725|nr:hypothetical protein [Clostridium sp. ZS2-4]MCY6355660.1 hypothetical protein [Clostridium sp. ZS2-4]